MERDLENWCVRKSGLTIVSILVRMMDTKSIWNKPTDQSMKRGMKNHESVFQTIKWVELNVKMELQKAPPEKC